MCPPTKANPETGVQTDEKKQHFDDIYVCDTPVPYKTRIMDKLEYISDDFNRAMFETHISPVFAGSTGGPIKYVDLCSCFGNTTMATLHGMSYKDICANWSTEDRCAKIEKPRRSLSEKRETTVTAMDISSQALSYGKSVGLYDETVRCDLNDRSSPEFAACKKAIAEADVVICTASLVYLELDTIRELVDSFSSSPGMMLVNFLNPFALEKADETKRILLEKLGFVASRATRHRKLSQLERDNYPEFGE